MDWKARSTSINIANYNRMSDEDKARMAAMLETLEANGGRMPDEPKDVQNLKNNNEIRGNFNLGGPQYSKTEVKNMNKSNKPWWWVPEDLGRKLVGDHYYDKNK